MEVTDGQEDNIPFLQENLMINKITSDDCCGKQLLWGDEKHMPPSAEGSTDLTIVCDCLYFTDFHTALLRSISFLLVKGGKALLVNPTRGSSMSQFLSLSEAWGWAWQEESFTEQQYQ